MSAAPPSKAQRCVAIALAIWLCAALTRADDEGSFTLSVEPGASCLNRETLLDELVVALEQTPITVGIDVQVVGSAHDPRSIVMNVRSSDGSESQRRFSPAPERCEHLHRTVALSLALIMKAAEEARLESPAAAQENAPAQPATSPRTADQAQPAATPAAPRLPRSRTAALGLAPSLAAGLIGNVAGGLRVHAAFRFELLSLSLVGSLLRSTKVEFPRRGEYQSTLLSAGLELCTRVSPRGLLRADLCFTPRVGSLRLQGFGLQNDLSAQRLFWGAALGVQLTYPLGDGWGVYAAGQLLLAGRRLEVVVRSPPPANEVQDADKRTRLGAELSAGVEFRFDYTR